MLRLFLSFLFVGWNVLTWNLSSGRFGVLELRAMPCCCEDAADVGALHACELGLGARQGLSTFLYVGGSLPEGAAPCRHALLGPPSLVLSPKERSFLLLYPLPPCRPPTTAARTCPFSVLRSSKFI